MKRIVGVLRPFDRHQNFYVYEDGNNIEKISVTVDEFAEVATNLAKKHDVQTIELNGPKQYARGLAKQLDQNLEIKII